MKGDAKQEARSEKKEDKEAAVLGSFWKGMKGKRGLRSTE